ncbi:MAG: hypothetical protein MK290_12275 [Pedosphaera sp.]|jgi:hypothetical protein|uniref:Uncharacterized protein n=1 Tax=marine metagenome TaxID=408172 RepID=A0A382CLW3_9ZZZZ|nr:hypothetical protein [Pedosphaera sp.]|tara:strand:- start:1075 stop:1575 length:501 start_codon:yes stop_codon:yes gene_type:complete
MLTFHELIGFMSPKMANRILEDTQANNREVYRALVASMAQAQKMRPVFIGRQPKERRHKSFVQMLSRAGSEEHAGNLIRGWLFKEHKDVLTGFLGKLGIEHEEGMVDDLPESISDDALNAAVDLLIEKYDRELVAVYLTAFNASNENRWGNLDALLAEDERLQFHG